MAYQLLVTEEVFTEVYKRSRFYHVHRLITNCNNEPKTFSFYGFKYHRVSRMA